MVTNRYMFYPDTKKAIHDYAYDLSINPEKRVSRLRRIAIEAYTQADRIIEGECVIESQSPTHIGADSDTPSVACEYSKRLVCEHGNCMIGCSTCHPPMP